jgi:hypothetical protein
MESHIAVFKGKEIRKTIHNNEWWFSVSDVVEVLTDSVNTADYIKKMRNRDSELSKGWGQIVTPLWMETQGGKQKINCANTEGMFRIIQSIPSPKAEPFKRWLAKVGYERVHAGAWIETTGVGYNRNRYNRRAPCGRGKQVSQILFDDVGNNHPIYSPAFLRASYTDYTGGTKSNQGTFKIITQKTCCELGKVRQVSHQHGILSKSGETNCPD